MDYEIEKLADEYTHLESIWNKLTAEWEKLSDYEDLYRIYPLLTTTAAISRKYIVLGETSSYSVTVVQPSSRRGMDTSDYLYRDEESFFNGEKKSLTLEKVAGLFLHQKNYGYMDNRRSDGKITPNVTIYLYVKTDILSESCALKNNGKYKEGKKIYQKSGAFTTYSDCTCGYYIDIASYLNAIKKIINKNKTM